jgi:hypothetical protein
MISMLHPTRRRQSLHGIAVAACLLAGAVLARADDDVADLLNNARPATTAPAAVTSSDAPEFRPTPGATAAPPRASAEARPGKIVLSDGTALTGQVWTTLQTPLRLWVEEEKRYHDVPLELVSRIEVHVLKEGLEEDWRWLKEGSDQKVYSGKKYPNVELAYRLTLLNGQAIEGTVVAPLYLLPDGPAASRPRTLALYKKYKGELGQTLKEAVYVKEVAFSPTPEPARTTHAPAFTRTLPLLPDPPQ